MFKQLFLSLLVLLVCVSFSIAKPLTLNQILEATCRVRAGGASGSGTCIYDEGQSYIYLTNAHVVGRRSQVYIEVFLQGKQSQRIPGRVIWTSYVNRTDVDFALIRVSKSSFRNYLPRVIGIAPRGYNISDGQYIASAGCPGARWPSAWEGHATGSNNSRVLFVPPPLGGQSGSGIHIYLKDNQGEWHTFVGAVLTWQIGSQGGAIPVNTLYRALYGQTDSWEPLKVPRNYKLIATTEEYAKDNKGNLHVIKQNSNGSRFVPTLPENHYIVDWNAQCPDGSCPPYNGGLRPPPRDPHLPVPPSRPPNGGGGVPDIGSPWPGTSPDQPEAPKEPEVDPEKEKLEKENKELKEKIDSLQAEKDKLKGQIDTLNKDYKNTQAEIKQITKKYENLTASQKAEIDKYNQQLVIKNAQLQELDRDKNEIQQKLAQVEQELREKTTELEQTTQIVQEKTTELEKVTTTVQEKTKELNKVSQIVEAQSQEISQQKNTIQTVEAVVNEKDEIIQESQKLKKWYQWITTGLSSIIGISFLALVWKWLRPKIRALMDLLEDRAQSRITPIVGEDIADSLRNKVDGLEKKIGDLIDKMVQTQENQHAVYSTDTNIKKK